jgi:hypothetical protein
MELKIESAEPAADGKGGFAWTVVGKCGRGSEARTGTFVIDLADMKVSFKGEQKGTISARWTEKTEGGPVRPIRSRDLVPGSASSTGPVTVNGNAESGWTLSWPVKIVYGEDKHVLPGTLADVKLARGCTLGGTLRTPNNSVYEVKLVLSFDGGMEKKKEGGRALPPAAAYVEYQTGGIS